MTSSRRVAVTFSPRFVLTPVREEDSPSKLLHQELEPYVKKTGHGIASRSHVAAASNVPVIGKLSPESGRGAEVALESLPFAAALLNSDGAVTGTNRMWSATRCDERYKAPAIQIGLRQVLGGRSASFSEDCEDAGGRYRITITRHGRGALIIQQLVDSSASPRSERMATVGRLLGGVAHDFANLLTLIGGYSDLLLNRVSEQDPLWAGLDEIRKAAQRGSRLTGQLLGFTRGQSVQLKPLDLNVIISDLQRMLHPVIGEHIELRTRLNPGVGNVVADAGQMEQVVMNLILNARDAMPRGGSITIETSTCEMNEGTAQAHGMKPGKVVLVSISDTGHGIEPAVLEHIWEPFFTTKEKGKGTGLGLNTVQRVIRESGGDIWPETAPGLGTTFTICLPHAGQGSDGVDFQPLAGPVPEGNETVLVVEDEDNVRRLLTQILRRRGYEVLEASHGEEALCIFERQAGKIHIVLTDMVMPGMTGRELANRLAQIQPDVKLIFMSGYTDDVLMRTGALGPGMPFLQKPLRSEALTAKVREALDSPARPFNPC